MVALADVGVPVLAARQLLTPFQKVAQMPERDVHIDDLDGATPEHRQALSSSAEHRNAGGLDAVELRSDDQTVPEQDQDETQRWHERVDPVERGGATMPPR